MYLKTGVFILCMVTISISQITEENSESQSGTKDTAQLNTIQTGLKTSVLQVQQNDNTRMRLTKADLESALTISKTGVILYGAGAGAEVTGAIVIVFGLASALLNENSSGEGTMIAGVGIALSGGALFLAGNIIACAGGSKARRVLINSANIAPPFRGWGYSGEVLD